mmetsp:Transcript_34825/g.62694  ORF Transcript_34825/g.62694 Transcript_34825/m.62694 type:complete len:106 (+) Transcript_34825:350-667(+)
MSLEAAEKNFCVLAKYGMDLGKALEARWSSDAFLLYIRKQVEQFSHNVSIRMLRFESFRHIPDRAPQISRLDPRQRNHPDNAETRRNIGGNSSRQAQLPAFSLFN